MIFDFTSDVNDFNNSVAELKFFAVIIRLSQAYILFRADVIALTVIFLIFFFCFIFFPFLKFTFLFSTLKRFANGWIISLQFFLNDQDCSMLF